MSMIENIRKSRIEKVQEFQKRGINPYPSKSKRDTMSNEIVSDYEGFEGKEVTVSGRIMFFRDLGKIAFLKLKDNSGEIQLYLKKEKLGDDFWSDLKLFDVGDFVDAKGIVCKTKTGEISVDVDTLDILAKSIKPLPEKWVGLQDEDKRFRQRYLDFLVNPDAKEKIEKRAKLTRFLREFYGVKALWRLRILP
jgi:lysyl-tRNA synthetase class 2